MMQTYSAISARDGTRYDFSATSSGGYLWVEVTYPGGDERSPRPRRQCCKRGEFQGATLMVGAGAIERAARRWLQHRGVKVAGA